MSKRSLDQLIGQILNTPPYQMPPVVHTGGTYQLDLDYKGFKLNAIKTGLMDCLEVYWDFVVDVNNRDRFKPRDFDKLPRAYGSETKATYQQQHKVMHTG